LVSISRQSGMLRQLRTTVVGRQKGAAFNLI
jgi:hypothetical protein